MNDLYKKYLHPLLLADAEDDAVAYAAHLEFLTSLGPNALDAVEELEAALFYFNPGVIPHAANALKAIGVGAITAVPKLLSVFCSLHDSPERFDDYIDDVREAVVDALVSIGQTKLEVLTSEIEDGSLCSFEYIDIIRLIGPNAEAAVPVLIDTLKNEKKYDWVRAIAADALGAIGASAKAAIPWLMEAMREGPDRVRLAAMKALEAIQPEVGPHRDSGGLVLTGDQARAETALDTRFQLSAMDRLEQMVPGVFTLSENIRTLKRFYLIGRAYELHDASSQRSVWKHLNDEISLQHLNKTFKDIQALFHRQDAIFERGRKGNQERISGLTEAGKMVWGVVAEIFKDSGL